MDGDPGITMAKLEAFLGAWEGVSEGPFGTARLERTAEYVLGGRFIRVTTRSTGAADAHEDIGFFSYDQQRRTLVFREFHNEGYVIHYVLAAADPGSLTFESEHIENPYDPTLRARTVIRLGNPLRETLELATGDEPFSACVEVTLHRAGTAG